MFEDSRVVDPTIVFADLAAAIEAIPVRPDRGLPGAAVTAQARALIGLSRALQARLLGRVAVIDDLQLNVTDGFGTPASWLRGYGNVDRGQATGLVNAARIAERLPALGALLAQGTIGPEHLQAVAAGARRVPEQVLAEHESTLGNLAPHARPSDLRRVAQKIQSIHDDTAVAADAAHAHDARHLHLSRTFGGTWRLDGTLDPVGGASLQVALEALLSTRGPEDTRSVTQRRADALVELAGIGLRGASLPADRLPDVAGDRPRLTFLVRTDTTHNGGSDDPGAPVAGGPVAGSSVLHAALAGLLHRIFHDLPGATTGVGPGAAIARSTVPAPPDGNAKAGAGGALAGFAAVSGTGLGGPAGAARVPAAVPTMVFDDQQLLIGCDTLLPTATIERVCCDAAINLTLVDRWDEPLNQGRSSRSHTPAQARAVIARDKHCVFPGCDAPPARCQIHHLIFWSHHGKTDLINLALVCWFHHHLIHEGGWALQRTAAVDRDDEQPGQPPGWLATAPDGRQLHQPRHHRQPAA